jgi:hypothetical protein
MQQDRRTCRGESEILCSNTAGQQNGDTKLEQRLLAAPCHLRSTPNFNYTVVQRLTTVLLDGHQCHAR